MALKKQINKTEFAALPEIVQKEYVADGENYKLDVEGEEDLTALKNAKDHEKAKRQEIEKQKKELENAKRELEAKLESLSDESARKNGDIDAIDKSYKEKLAKVEADKANELEKLKGTIRKSLVDNKALELATKISTAPALILPHIKARLQADFDGEQPVTRILDAAGQLSALSLDDLANEFIANKDFSAIIQASKATGGAGSSGNNAGGGNNQSNLNQPADFLKATPAQQAGHIAEKIAARNKGN